MVWMMNVSGNWMELRNVKRGRERFLCKIENFEQASRGETKEEKNI